MHANARLTVWARREIVRRCLAGVSQAEIARQFRVSRATVSKWWRRYQTDPRGEWYRDRSSRPLSCSHQTSPELEARIVDERKVHRLGPARIGYRLGVPSSTVWKVLRRHGLNRLRVMDRVTGERVRRYEKNTPGELIHVDTKKIARIAEGGGWRVPDLDGGLKRNPKRKNTGRLRTRSRRHRRPLPARLHRDPPRHQRRNLRRVLDQSQNLLRIPRHRSQSSHDRQLDRIHLQDLHHSSR